MSRPPLATLVVALALMAAAWHTGSGRDRGVDRRNADVEHEGLCDTSDNCQVDVVWSAGLCLGHSGGDNLDAVRWHHHHRSIYASRRSGQLQHATARLSTGPAPSMTHPLAHDQMTCLSSPPFTRRL